MQNNKENKLPPLCEYNVEHWYGDYVFQTLNYTCWAENSEHAIEQCMDHYKNEKVDITIRKTYKISDKEYKE